MCYYFAAAKLLKSLTYTFINSFNKLFSTLFMQYLKTIQLILTFYRSFLTTSFFLTALCIGIFWKYGIIAFTGIFWFKICTLILIYYFISGLKAKEFLYYQNLGISKWLL